MRLRVLAAGVALSVFPAAARAQQAAPPAAVQGSQSDEEMAEDAVDPGDAIVVEASRRLPGAVIGDIPPDQQLGPADIRAYGVRSEEHTSELQSLMRISYAVFCLKKKKIKNKSTKRD